MHCAIPTCQPVRDQPGSLQWGRSSGKAFRRRKRTTEGQSGQRDWSGNGCGRSREGKLEAVASLSKPWTWLGWDVGCSLSCVIESDSASAPSFKYTSSHPRVHPSFVTIAMQEAVLTGLPRFFENLLQTMVSSKTYHKTRLNIGGPSNH